MLGSTTLGMAGRWSSGVGLGVLVIALYGVFVTAVFGGFASYMTRTAWNTEARALNPDAPDLDGLFHLTRREDALNEAITATQAQLSEIDELISVALEELDQVAIERTVVEGDRQHAALVSLSEMRGVIDLFSEDAAIKVRAVISPSDVPAVVQVGQLMELAPELDLTPGLSADRAASVQALLIAASDRMVAMDRTLADLDLRQMTNERARDRHEAARVWPESQMTGFLEELTVLKKEIGPNSPERARIGGIKHIFWGIPYMLVGFPTIFLTLLVTIAAGGLGAVVAFSRTILRGGGEASMSSLLVSVGEGIAAAMAIFLFSGAGMLALAQGTDGAASLELSPYTVAFVAFISGFMAEDAFASIQGAGKRYFAATDDQTSAAAAQPLATA